MVKYGIYCSSEFQLASFLGTPSLSHRLFPKTNKQTNKQTKKPNKQSNKQSNKQTTHLTKSGGGAWIQG